ncbi:non-canonical purine NTP pyrophosphatase [Streptantibioticus cattleyicolor]|uniref:Non-canonical purine NTP pyrophosphatase n=1 Tax=Streptantibioticus cattleyicolor (strain ATCC 35852 / DSM 46488 / JCM 4925 / NBRC 14057 / NRRL 8057) TaxID=1003195 RepID=F8JJA1_STREN|nr:non-canonical purine NTP pyrophosphatase [Streptantibioticus cattleyicolor]AEW98789.1 hypothetical protein SCATT_p05960 [Streptantibioticus cattleyicolor NRRL 8057 = DSM 46488]CCB72160.1 putative Protein HAM1 [Streptantibioticus cattleyicolor NRRL 8057 = DSM 46488]
MSQPATGTNRILLASENPIKLEEVAAVFPGVEPAAVELTEIQSTDVQVVVEHKLDQVAQLDLPAPVLVEDTGLFVESWNGLPGALVKWFVEGMGAQRLKEAALPPGAPAGATAVSAVGIAWRGERQVWTGRTEGRLIDARGGLGGWTPVFEVADTGRTLGEMSFADRMRWTMRRAPLEHARAWLRDRGHHH